MKNLIKIQDFITILYWVKISSVIEGKNFKYENLLMQAETYLYNGTPLDTRIHRIDDLMIDAYQIYHKIKFAEKRINEFMDQFGEQIEQFGQLFSVNREGMDNERKKYTSIIESILENFKFDDPEIVGIQRGYLSEKMKECIEIEDYESAARFRDIMKS